MELYQKGPLGDLSFLNMLLTCYHDLLANKASIVGTAVLCSLAAICSGSVPTLTDIKDLIVNRMKLKLSRNPTVLPSVDREGNQALGLA